MRHLALGRFLHRPSIDIVNRRCLSIGQPYPLTHPHLLKLGEVNSGLQRSEFVQRRSNLAEVIRQAGATKVTSLLHASSKQHLVVIPSAQRSFMYDNIPYPFRQNTDYRYLTGGMEPDCVLVMDVRKDFHRSYLFVRDPDPKEEMWEGARTMADSDAADFFGVDNCYHLDNLNGMLKSYGKESRGEFLLWYDYLKPKSEKVHSVLMNFIESHTSNEGINSPREQIHKVRLNKSASEANLMRKTCDIASEAIKDTMRNTRFMTREMEVHANVEHFCRAQGAQGLAYPPVVAAGANSTIVHYTQSSQVIEPGSMVLVDAGCDFHGYTSDVTRTWPSHGRRFTEPQRILYEVVLKTQQDLFEILSRRAKKRTTVDSLFYDMLDILSLRLQEAGVVVPGELAGADRKLKVRNYCPHHVSHYLGMDVHDCTSASKDLELTPGMVITLEPGVYVAQQENPSSRDRTPGVRDEFRGLGIRIEDDVLITESGFEILTDKCPRTVEDVENTCLGDGESENSSGDDTNNEQSSWKGISV